MKDFDNFEDEFEMYADLDFSDNQQNPYDIDSINKIDIQDQLLDRKEVYCYEVQKWEWICPECGEINREDDYPRGDRSTSCSACDEIFIPILGE